MLTLHPPAPVWPLTRAPPVSRVWSGYFLSCPLAVPVRWDEAGDHVLYACPSLPERVLPWQGGSFPPCAAATPGAHRPLRQLERLGGLLALAPTHPQGTGRLPSGGGGAELVGLVVLLRSRRRSRGWKASTPSPTLP